MAQNGEFKQSGHYLDVGFGKRITLSSSKHDAPASEVLIPARNPGGVSFHTNLDENPWISVDLEGLRKIKTIRVFNDENTPDRALPASIHVSLNGQDWRLIAHITETFGGRRTNAPFELVFRAPIYCRFVKYEVLRQSFLHLDYIEILSYLEDSNTGRYRTFKFDGGAIEVEYIHFDSHGFAWTFTCALGAVLAAVDSCIAVSKIDFSLALAQFKDETFADPYLDLFCPGLPPALDVMRHVPMIERHGIYAHAGLDKLLDYVRAYFSPSQQILDIEARFIEKYSINLSECITLIYRGTDKAVEVRPVPVTAYIDVARHLIDEFGPRQICVQTDQAQALEAILSNFPDAVYLREIPVTKGSTAIHNLDLEQEFGVKKSVFARHLLAMIHMYSRSAYVITHTGNIGAWVALYRGNTTNLYQFDESGDLRDPNGNVINIAA